ncbi:MAG TPA: DUF5681 domain-containing protein [Pyrinomonadaceae bacterium]|nr:DUF5681 domain-containing protein [Pyrinomonadaceae bacterium]
MGSRDGDYDVGYGKPPKEHQWKKGQSGGGRRPKRSPCGAKYSFNPFLEKFLTEMSRKMTFKEGGNPVELEAIEGIFRSLAVKALRGDHRSQRLALEVFRAASEQRMRDMVEGLQQVRTYKAEWAVRAADAERSGKPVPLPRAEHVDFSIERGVIETTGPTEEAQDKAWQDLKRRLRMLTIHEKEAEEAHRVCANDVSKSQLLKSQKAFRKLERLVPPGWNWRECITDEDRRHYQDWSSYGPDQLNEN